MTAKDLAAALRKWASGSFCVEAATELIVRSGRGRFAEPGWPWIHTNDDGWVWVDFEVIPGEIGALSGGEQRILRIAASLGAGTLVDLSTAFDSLDRANTRLALAAIAHAAGSHDHSDVIVRPDTAAGVVLHATSLFPWLSEPDA